MMIDLPSPMKVMLMMMQEPCLVSCVLHIIINMTFIGDSRSIITYKQLPSLINKVIQEYSIDLPESNEIVHMCFWALMHMTMDGPSSAAVIIDAGVLDTIVVLGSDS